MIYRCVGFFLLSGQPRSLCLSVSKWIGSQQEGARLAFLCRFCRLSLLALFSGLHDENNCSPVICYLPDIASNSNSDNNRLAPSQFCPTVRLTVCLTIWLTVWLAGELRRTTTSLIATMPQNTIHNNSESGGSAHECLVSGAAPTNSNLSSPLCSCCCCCC